jgi:hypothetical protein
MEDSEWGRERPEKRQFFRIKYPPDEQPTLHIHETDFKVIDISEGGVRFLCDIQGGFEVNQVVEAMITFHDGESEPLFGRVSRILGEEVAIQTSHGITFNRAMKEQRHLIQKSAEDPEA